MVRVLVVDDSAFMRKTIADMLAASGEIEVVATARDGLEAVEKAAELKPDVITLDVEMPRLDGLEALRRIMAQNPLPVIMLSSLTQVGAEITIQALMAGALDFVPKPSGAISLDIDKVRDELIRKVFLASKVSLPQLLRSRRVMAGGVSARLRPEMKGRVPPATGGERVVKSPSGQIADPVPRREGSLDETVGRPSAPGRTDLSSPPAGGRFRRVVVVGTSTGGPGALHEVIPRLPADLPAPLLVVQHMPPGFTRTLAERLDRLSAVAVKEAEAGDRLEAGQVLVAPGGYHLEVSGQGTVNLTQSPPQHGVRPAVDVTLESVVAAFGAASLAVIMTGMGFDGARGAALVKRAGGLTIAEHESSCVIYGMPRAVVESGLADRVVPLEEIPEAIVDGVRS
ncbi:MAG: chemotaxis response regulator protein-glutamate methylesterase [Firmicutes bacterium]|nr:chemotaxis response regulator protein-glutamate methylesterase [Bacillota bacterium]MCL5040848.1 chemotaxis response regulator protein-glutamate methylesterase [Bacillota bacterium]